MAAGAPLVNPDPSPGRIFLGRCFFWDDAKDGRRSVAVEVGLNAHRKAVPAPM